jgi:UDP-N-acetylmuramoyl-tripeptide--D-alanyl-D-alanine ligase
LKWYYQGQGNTVQTKIYGSYNYENILAAISIGQYFDVDTPKIKAAISGYKPSNNRSQFLFTKRNNTVLLDAYNANPTSMEMALQDFATTEYLNKWIIIGDMLEVGAHSIFEHQSIIKSLKIKGFQHIILVGEIFSTCQVPANWYQFKDLNSLVKWLNVNTISESTILIKGSRKIALEKLIELL